MFTTYSQNAGSSAESNEVRKGNKRQTHQKEQKMDLFLFTNDIVYRKIPRSPKPSYRNK